MPVAKRSLHAEYTPAGADRIGRLELARDREARAIRVRGRRGS